MILATLLLSTLIPFDSGWQQSIPHNSYAQAHNFPVVLPAADDECAEYTIYSNIEYRSTLELMNLTDAPAWYQGAFSNINWVTHNPIENQSGIGQAGLIYGVQDGSALGTSPSYTIPSMGTALVTLYQSYEGSPETYNPEPFNNGLRRKTVFYNPMYYYNITGWYGGNPMGHGYSYTIAFHNTEARWWGVIEKN